MSLENGKYLLAPSRATGVKTLQAEGKDPRDWTILVDDLNNALYLRSVEGGEFRVLLGVTWNDERHKDEIVKMAESKGMNVTCY